MHIGILKFTLHLPGSNSLKEKRKVINSLCQRLRNRFPISVAEVEDNDAWKTATIGMSCVSNSTHMIHQTFSQIINFLQTNAGEYILSDHKQEIISGF